MADKKGKNVRIQAPKKGKGQEKHELPTLADGLAVKKIPGEENKQTPAKTPSATVAPTEHHEEEKKKPKKKRSCYQRSIRLRHPYLLNPGHPGIAFLRLIDMITWIVYYFIIRKIQFDNLPEGPPFFDPYTEYVRYFNDVHRKDFSYESRTFIDTSKPMYYYKRGDRAHDYFIMDMSSINFGVLKMPLGIWILQIPPLIRLTLACFVGFYDNGLAMRQFPKNLIYVRNHMWLPLMVGFPFQLIDFLLKKTNDDSQTSNAYLLAHDRLFIFISAVGLLRIRQFWKDLDWLRIFLGFYVFDILFFIFFGSIAEQMVEYLWLHLPESYCFNEVRQRDLRHKILDCWNNNCSLFRVSFEGNNSCYKETWWSEISAVTRLYATTFKYRVLSGNRTGIELVNVISNIQDLSIFHHFFIYTTTKGVGIGYGAATNIYEALFVIFTLAGGHFFYNWKISGYIDTIALAGDAGRVEDEKQMAIVNSFCKMHDADPETVAMIKSYCRVFQATETHHMIETEAFRRRLPPAYQDLVMFSTLLKILQTEIRLFQDLGARIQLCLAYQFETANFVRGDTVFEPHKLPPGLMYIRQGYMAAFHLDPKRGGIVRLHTGDFFGELSLSFNFVSPVLIKATTDCEVFVLYKHHYLKVLPLLPQYIQARIVENHADIINTLACRYHERMVVKRPRIFPQASRDYHKGKGLSLSKLGLKLGSENEGGALFARIHDMMPSYKRWTYAMAIIGIIAAALTFIDINPCDIYDVIIPCNPYSLFQCRFNFDVQDPYFDLILSSIIGVLLFLLTLVFIIDAIIVLIAGINTPYGIIGGTEALKIKLGKKKGQENYIKLVAPLYVGLKVMRFKDMIKDCMVFSKLLVLAVVLLLILIVMACHYGARAIENQARVIWEEGMCNYMDKEWTTNYTLVKNKLMSLAFDYDIKGFLNISHLQENATRCNATESMIWDPLCVNYLPMTPKIKECITNITAHPHCEEMSHFHRDIVFLNYSVGLCNNTYRKLITEGLGAEGEKLGIYESLYQRYLRVLYELLTIAAAEGSDVTAYYVTDNGRYYSLVIVIISGIIFRGLIDAYLLTKYTQEYSQTIHVYKRLKRLSNHLKNAGTSVHARDNVYDFLSACFMDFHQITIPEEAVLLHSLPVRLKRFALEKKLFLSIKLFHSREYMMQVMNTSREYFFPPGICCTYEGDLDASLMLIIRGHCVEIDEFGNYYIRGPGDVIGLTSLWTGHQSSTVLCFTFVQCFVIPKRVLVNAMEILPCLKRYVVPAFIESSPVMVTSNMRIDDFKVEYGVSYGDSSFIKEALKKFRLSNIVNKVFFRAPSKKHWNVAHKIFLLNITFNPFTKAGDAYLIVKALLLVLSIFVSSAELGFLMMGGISLATCEICDIIIILMTYIDWHMMYYNHEGVIIKDSVLTCKNWMRNKSFWGFLTSFPFEVILIFIDLEIVDDNRVLYAGFKFGFRFLRYLPYMNTVAALRKLHPDWTRTLIICKSVINILLVLHLFALWWFLVQCHPKVETVVQEGVSKTLEYCNLPSWSRRFYDKRLLDVIYDERSEVSDNDHNQPFLRKQPECDCNDCSCNVPWRLLWDRYLTSGYQNLLEGEGRSAILLRSDRIDPFEYYGISIYWAAQSVGTIGLGDINILDHEEMLWSYFLLMVGVFWYAFCIAELTAVLVVFDEAQAQIYILVAEQRSYLNSKKQHEMLKRVTQAEEMRFASKVYLLENERENLPRSLYSQICLESIKNVLPILVGGDSNLTRGQLRLLARRLKRVIIPRGDFVIRDQDLISGIFILVEGFCKVKYNPGGLGKERVDDDFDDVATLVNYNDNAPTSGAKKETDDGDLTEEELEMIMRSAEFAAPSELDPGACFGVTGHNDYEFWNGNIVAKVPCQAMILTYENIKDMKEEYGNEFVEVLQTLYQNVEISIAKVMLHIKAVESARLKVLRSKAKMLRRDYTSVTEGDTELHLEEGGFCKRKREAYITRRNVFHPSENIVNILLIISSTFKLIAATSASLYVTFLGFEESWNGWMGQRNVFITIMILSFLMTLAEIVFKFHTGFIDRETGRVSLSPPDIYYHYLKTPSQMPLDVVSLFPLWIFYFLIIPLFTQNDVLGQTKFVFVRLSMLLFLVPNYIQASRSIQFYYSPTQPRPYSMTLFMIKQLFQTLLTIFLAFAVAASAWILVGCPNGAIDYAKCSQPGWIRVAYKTKPIYTSLHLLINSFYFSMSTAVGAGIGDITGHNLGELYLFTVLFLYFAMLNSVLQAQIVSNMYAIAAQAEKSDKLIEEFEVAMSTFGLKKQTQNTIMNYLNMDRCHEFRLQNLFVDLHPGLRKDVHYALCKKFLKLLKLTCTVGVARRLSLYVEEQIYLPGDLVVPFGSIIDEVFFVVSGNVTLTFNGRNNHLSDGELINDLSDIRIRPANFEVICDTLTFVYKLKFSIYCHIMLEASRKVDIDHGRRRSNMADIDQSRKNKKHKNRSRGIKNRNQGPTKQEDVQAKKRTQSHNDTFAPGTASNAGVNRLQSGPHYTTSTGAGLGVPSGNRSTSPSMSFQPGRPSDARIGKPKNVRFRFRPSFMSRFKRGAVPGAKPGHRPGTRHRSRTGTTSSLRRGTVIGAIDNRNVNRYKSKRNTARNVRTDYDFQNDPPTLISNAGSELNANQDLLRVNETGISTIGTSSATISNERRSDRGRDDNLKNSGVNVNLSPKPSPGKAPNLTIDMVLRQGVTGESENWFTREDDDIEDDEEDESDYEVEVNIDTGKLQENLKHHFTDQERRQMREVEVWARLLERIKTKILPTGSDQVATLLAWEAFERNVIQPKNKTKSRSSFDSDDSFKERKEFKGNLITRAKPGTGGASRAGNPVRPKPPANFASRSLGNTDNNKWNPPGRWSPSDVNQSNFLVSIPSSSSKGMMWVPSSAKQETGGPLRRPNDTLSRRADYDTRYANQNWNAWPGAEANGLWFAPEEDVEEEVVEVELKTSAKPSKKPSMTLVGQHAMNDLLRDEKKTWWQRARERILRKLMSKQSFLEGELARRPHWEQLIHDAEID